MAGVPDRKECCNYGASVQVEGRPYPLSVYMHIKTGVLYILARRTGREVAPLTPLPTDTPSYAEIRKSYRRRRAADLREERKRRDEELAFPQRLTAFKAELKALLEKHNASIAWGCGPCSDTHGIYDEHMSISIGSLSEDVCSGSTLGAQDLEPQ